VIVGPIHRKCPGVVVVAVDKIAERCKQATETLSSNRSRRRTWRPDAEIDVLRSVDWYRNVRIFDTRNPLSGPHFRSLEG
jgi:hypothetical protein